MTADNPALEKRFVLFFDFLGASNAAKTWPRERVHQFVDLLIAVSNLRSAQDISGQPQDDGSFRISVVPEITTFSDCVVVSYPAFHDREQVFEALGTYATFKSHWTAIALKDSIRILVSVAERALRIGLLIRGGLSFGQFYHENGVAFGEALVDAYELESKVAKAPRVLVADSVVTLARLDPTAFPSVLLKDTDGKWHLNYFTDMVRQALPKAPGTLPPPVEQATRWRDAHLEQIDREIADLEKVNDGRAAKWRWFKERFEEATAEFPAFFSL